jgi:hypothetical protein
LMTVVLRQFARAIFLGAVAGDFNSPAKLRRATSLWLV